MEPRENSSHNQHSLSLSSLIRRQCNLIKDSLVDMDNQFNEIFLSFIPLHSEFFFSLTVSLSIQLSNATIAIKHKFKDWII